MGRKKGKKKKDSGGTTGGANRQEKLASIAEQELKSALCHIANDEYSESIRHFTQAINLASHKRDFVIVCMNARSVAWMALQNYEEAACDCAAVVVMDKVNVRGWLRYAAVLCLLDKFSEAASCLKNVFDFTPPESLSRLKELEEKCSKWDKNGSNKDSKVRIVEDIMEESGLSDLSVEEDEMRSEMDKDASRSDGSTLLTDVFGGLPPLVPAEYYYTQNYEDLMSDMKVDTKEEKGLMAPAIAVREKTLGNEAFLKEELEEALQHYSRAIFMNPRDHVYYSNRAATNLKLERYHDAISDCTTSVKLRPSIKAYARRAHAWSELHEWTLATQDYLCALRFEPNNTDVWNHLLRCLSENEKYYKKMSEESPDNVNAFKAWRHARDGYNQLVEGGVEQALRSVDGIAPRL